MSSANRFGPGACCCGGLPSCSCGDCAIPQQNLTVSWTNTVIGNGSTTFFYTAPCSWSTGCVHGLIYEMICNAFHVVEFRVRYFISGVCPTGQSEFCSTEGANPKRLVRTGLTCGDDFLLTATCDNTSCSNLAANGYTGFTVNA